MPIYEVQKNGKTYEVDVPDVNALEQAVKEIPDQGSTVLGTAKAAGTGLAQSVPDFLGAATSGAIASGQMDSPKAAAFGARQAPPSWLPNWMAGGVGDWLRGRPVGTTADNLRAEAQRRNETASPSTVPSAPSPGWLTNKVGNAVGGWREPQGTIEDLVQAGARAAPMGLMAPASGAGGIANAAARMGAFGFVPGVTGRGAYQASESMFPGQQVPIPNPFTGEKIADVPLSGIASAVGSLAAPTRMTARKITPFTQHDPSRTTDADIVRHETGRYPTVGQIFGNQKQINREINEDPGINLRQSQDLTRAYTRNVGAGAETPQVSKGAGNWFDTQRGDIDLTFRNLANTVFADPRVMGSGISNTQLYNDFARLSSQTIANRRPEFIRDTLDLFRSVNPRWVPSAAGRRTGAATAPEEQLHDALFAATPLGAGTRRTIPMGGSRPMTAVDYQRLRDTLHQNARIADPDRGAFYRNVADILDHSVENTLAAHGNHPLAMAWNHNRSQQRALEVIENAAGMLPPGTNTLSPNVMQSADLAVSGLRPYLRGTTPFSNLTNAAGNVLKPLKEEQIPKRPGWLARQVNKVPGGSLVTENMPMLTGAGAFGGTALNFGATPEVASTLAILGGMIGRNPFVTSRTGTVGTGPMAQAYGRNQIIPLPRDQETQRRLQAMGRALMIPQQNMYDQPNQ